MFKSFLSALIYEFLAFLKKHDDFFALSQSGRLEKLNHFKAPMVFKKYLSEISASAFLKDLQMVLQLIHGADLRSLSIRDSAFFKTLLEFFSTHFASKLDQLDARFYLRSDEERQKSAKNLIESDSLVANTLRELLTNYSYQELAEAFEQLSKLVAEGASILVQIPQDISPELKREIREQLQVDYPQSFPVFQINRELIGGFRVFLGGENRDYSWFSQVQKLSSLSTLS